MGGLEKIGLLKMDFLGLRTLTVIDNTVRLIRKTRGEFVDVMNLPMDDVETYQLLQKGDAKGVFQLESEGIRELLKRMRPDNLRDLIAIMALYRPGPLQGGMVDSYVNRKHGREKWEDPHPFISEILSPKRMASWSIRNRSCILNRLGELSLQPTRVHQGNQQEEAGDHRSAENRFRKRGAGARLTFAQAEHIFGPDCVLRRLRLQQVSHGGLRRLAIRPRI